MLEEQSPGTKHQMYFGFLKKAAHRFEEANDADSVASCSRCGAPTLTAAADDPVCALCRMKDLAARRKADPASQAKARSPQSRKKR